MGALPTALEPRELVLRAQEGDAQAEAVLCHRLAPAIRAFASRRLRTRDAVDEFTQDVLLMFLQAVRSRAVEQPERVGGFVLGVCRNLARDRAKQSERRQNLWETFGAVLAEVVSVPPREPCDRILRLDDCLTKISQRARDVLWLGFAEGKSHDEIGSQLSISAQNARVVRHRSLVALRECMSQPLGASEVA